MAVVATTTYLYVNASLTQFFVQGTELVDKGPWSSSTFYAINDVVQIGVDQYVALAANVNAMPTGIVDENWSTLVIVEEAGSISSAGSDWYARYLAGEAYSYAGTAYYWGTTAYQIGTANTSLIIAETGSRIATDNYIISLIGSTSGSVYVDLAAETGSRIAADLVLTWAGTDEQGTRSYADQVLTNAIITEQGTRSWQDQVLANAIVDEAGSRAAADAAIVSFVFGSIAVDLAAETGSRIAADLALYWAGTNEAATRQASDQQIISIVETGTNTANSAWALAQLGTIIPPLSTLPDVSIPAPSAQQVLAFDGSLWVAMDAPSAVAPGAYAFFTDAVASGTDTYYNAVPVPSGAPEATNSFPVGGGNPFVTLNGFITPVLNRTVIDAGVWQFNTYASTSNTTQTFAVITDVYTRSISGVETYLFSGTSPLVNSLTAQLVSAIVTQGTFSTSVTDKIIFKYAALRSASPATTATLYAAGTAHDSNVMTPIGYAHNDLDGLQGGSSTQDQFYHMTLDQHDALVGTSGYPSASNPYVTLDSLTTEQGTRSSADQALLNALIVEQGTRSYQDQVLANTIVTVNTIEQGTRSQEDQNLQNQITTLQDILGIGFYGTVSLYLAQILYGKPDTALVAINGVVSSRSDLYYSWEDFQYYGTTTGTNYRTSYDQSTSWGDVGVIYTNNLAIGVNGTDSMNLYATGTVTQSSVNSGTGWASAGTFYQQPYWYRFMGTDTFESYAVGTLSSSGSEMTGGGGWAGGAVVYSGSNRP